MACLILDHINKLNKKELIKEINLVTNNIYNDYTWVLLPHDLNESIIHGKNIFKIEEILNNTNKKYALDTNMNYLIFLNSQLKILS